jgi:hypothetical protein
MVNGQPGAGCKFIAWRFDSGTLEEGRNFDDLVAVGTAYIQGHQFLQHSMRRVSGHQCSTALGFPVGVGA